MKGDEHGPAVGRWRRAWRSQRAAGVTCFVLAIVFALLAGAAADRDAQLGPGAPTAQATVVDTRFTGRRTEIVLTFTTADGQQVKAQTEEYLGMPEVGDVITVQYRSEDPEYYVRERGATSRLDLIFYSAAAVVLVFAGALGLRGRLPRWALNR